jgi:hypothetical protein
MEPSRSGPDSAGNENYTQADIVQIARAFTGWRYEWGRLPRRGRPRLRLTSRARPQGDHRRPGVRRERGAEGDTVIDIIFTLTDMNGFNIRRRTARRLLEYYVGPVSSLGRHRRGRGSSFVAT